MHTDPGPRRGSSFTVSHRRSIFFVDFHEIAHVEAEHVHVRNTLNLVVERRRSVSGPNTIFDLNHSWLSSPLVAVGRRLVWNEMICDPINVAGDLNHHRSEHYKLRFAVWINAPNNFDIQLMSL